MTITWIEGHAQKNGASVFISVPHITVVTPLEKFVRIYTDDGDYTDISDDYEEVKEAIIKMSDVADIITEADPRPDTTNPLTWKDRKDARQRIMRYLLSLRISKREIRKL